ncbi:unnamed protein product [Phytomonas sp. Hart1]|nr:unnamed protein product [Phytomonas sp. Hart1]|eukprot:CCW68324.1 unnamed protein product [Phytomonas sp. isolate Hart1]
MLNINAKSFVPPGAIYSPLSSRIDIVFYQYRIDVPLQKTTELSSTAKVQNLYSLIFSKDMVAVRGGLDEESLYYFLSTIFMSATNVPYLDGNTMQGSGFLLSRRILSLHADVKNINILNNAPGYLVRLNIAGYFGFNGSVLISNMWKSFFDKICSDPKFISMGYVRSLVGLNKGYIGGTYHHYFFAACSSLDAVRKIQEQLLKDSSLQPLRVLPISSIIPFLCGPKNPLGIVITIGENAREKYLEGSVSDFSLEMDYFVNDPERTRQSLETFEKSYLFILNGDCRWEKTYVAHLYINPIISQNDDNFQICDVLRYIGNLCADTATTIIGVSFSRLDLVPGSYELNMLNKKAPFFENASFDEIMERRYSFDTVNLIYPPIPQSICGSMRSSTFMSAVNAIHTFRLSGLTKLLKEKLLTLTTLQDAADHFANHLFFARCKSLGTPILLGTDNDGNVFGVDLCKFSIFGLPNVLLGVAEPLRGCLFKGTLTSSHYDILEYRIMIEDVFIFHGKEVYDRMFIDRWHLLENTDLNEEDSCPHATYNHIVVLKAGYVSIDKTETLIKTFSSDHAIQGIVFVCDDASVSDNTSPFAYLWKPPASLTIFFTVSKVESAPEGDNAIKRAFLSVRVDESEKSFTEYEGEYVDFFSEAYPEIKIGSVVNCIPRYSNDGARWWDILRSYESELHSVSTYKEVYTLLQSPGINQKEMLWLLNARSYLCERCHKVNDSGEMNPQHNAYWCEDCWNETGHGNCIYCGMILVLGMLDAISNFFYCEDCWNIFYSTNTQAEIGYHVPPPPEGTFKEQVMTRCISLLIDKINPKFPTNDVLDLCCGGSVVRKWMFNKTVRYVGVDLQASAVDSVLETISNSSELPPNGEYDVICANAFSVDFWICSIAKIHPRQFQTIACFSGLHHAFSDEMVARHFISSVASALVPGGLFLGFLLDSSVLYSKGEKYGNSVFSTEWKEGSVPRIGQRFSISVDKPLHEVAVIPIDFLVAVGSEYGLKVVLEACQTVRGLIEKDASWTRVPSVDEKEYFCALKSFAFKKESNKQLPSTKKAPKNV